MANPHRADASINLGSFTLACRPTFEALANLEDRLGTSVFHVLSQFSDPKTCRVGMVISILEICQSGTPRRTRTEIADGIQSVGMATILVKVIELLSQGMTSDADLAKANEAKEAPVNP